MRKKYAFFQPLSHWRKELDQEPELNLDPETDPDPHQNVTDSQHWLQVTVPGWFNTSDLQI